MSLPGLPLLLLSLGASPVLAGLRAGPVAAGPAPPAPRSLWLFSDASGLAQYTMDIDDDIVVALLLAQRDVPVAGLSATYGNAPARVSYINTRLLVDRLALPETRKPSVYRADECLLPLVPGLCRDFRKAPPDEANDSDAAFISYLRSLRDGGGKSTVIILGPTSAFTAALMRVEDSGERRSLLAAVESVHFVGGSSVAWERRNLVDEIVSLFYHLGEWRLFLDGFLTLGREDAGGRGRGGAPRPRLVMYTAQTLSEASVYNTTIVKQLEEHCKQAGSAASGRENRYPTSSVLCPYLPALKQKIQAKRWTNIFGNSGLLFDLGVVAGVLFPDSYSRWDSACITGLWPFRMEIQSGHGDPAFASRCARPVLLPSAVDVPRLRAYFLRRVLPTPSSDPEHAVLAWNGHLLLPPPARLNRLLHWGWRPLHPYLRLVGACWVPYLNVGVEARLVLAALAVAILSLLRKCIRLWARK